MIEDDRSQFIGIDNFKLEYNYDLRICVSFNGCEPTSYRVAHDRGTYQTIQGSMGTDKHILYILRMIQLHEQ